MRDAKKMAKKLKFSLPLAGVLVLLAMTLPGCKSSTSTDTSDTTTTVARILVTNTYGKTLEIFMDGSSQFALTNGNGGTITNVSIATHTMEGKLLDGTVIDTTTIDVTSLTDYSYLIDRPDINVTNAFGETLKIYYDDVYQFTIVDDENRWLIGVSLASHFLKATRASGDTEVASTTINVAQNKDYSWTIQ
jgi:hypothetical protein